MVVEVSLQRELVAGDPIARRDPAGQGSGTWTGAAGYHGGAAYGSARRPRGWSPRRHPHPQQRTRRPLARAARSDRHSARAVRVHPSAAEAFLSVGKRQDLLTLADLLATGQVTPVIDRTHPSTKQPTPPATSGPATPEGRSASPS